MSSNRKASMVLPARLLAVACAAALSMPAVVAATDIAWHGEAMTVYSVYPNYERKGTAVLTTGEKATYVFKGVNESQDAKGMVLWKQEALLTFEDAATISLQASGRFDPDTQTSRGTGTFVRGTGRFTGITGEFTQVSRPTSATIWEVDAKGTYSLPAP